MKPIHIFEQTGGEISASSRKLALFSGKNNHDVFLRHSLKDGIPLYYWFVIETKDFWFDVDLRKLLSGYEDYPYMRTLLNVRDELREFFTIKKIDDENINAFLRGFSDVWPDSITAERKRKE